MAVGRKKPQRLRDLGLQSERLLWPTKGPSAFEEELGPEQLERSLGLTTLEKAVAWAQTHSMWPDTFGLACCAIEMMQTGGPRSDLDRFGMAPRASPRVSDLIIVSGTLTLKMALRTKILFDQMPDPKYVVSMGSCANCGGLFQLAYSVCDGVDKVIPVDVYVPGCPPRPEALTEGLVKLQEKISQERWLVRKDSSAALPA